MLKKVECNTRQVDDVIASYKKELNSCDATIKVSDLPVIFTDKTLFTIIITQLLNNSIKFRQESPLVIEINAIEDDTVWRFSIKDNGIGIELEYAQKIFELFYKHHQHEKYSGTGFGLALCKKILSKSDSSRLKYAQKRWT
jgi:light-regulated signal transduction histidine kinase (bacteriophytochrome)